MVLWMGCFGVGMLGLRLHYPWPRPPSREPPPTQATIVHVELTNQAMAPPDIGAPSPPPDALTLAAPPPIPSAPAALAAPPLLAVAAPGPAIAFALPTDAPARIVPPSQAVPSHSSPTTATVAPNVSPPPPSPQRLTYGQGEGRQPAPQYPREAAMARQEGVVIVRFTVGEDGRVQTAQAISPCPFPLLNQAAVRAVRETWRFRAGPTRSYEVAIQFQLRQR
jgi:protein TonB